MKYFSAFFLIVFLSCNWATEKTKKAVNKTGEVVAKTGSEFVQGLSKGVEKTFQNEVEISEDLKKKGLSAGKIIIRGTDTSTDNILTAYLIFENEFDQTITIKVISEEDQEYGRVTQHVNGKKGEANYIDFVFDKRTNIDSKGKLLFK